MAIKNVVFDFDGTCTQIPVIFESYLKRYLRELNSRVMINGFTLEGKRVTDEEWKDAQEFVRENSPKAGWTLNNTSAAPAAADPYILAFESTRLILRTRREGRGEAENLPFELHGVSNEANEAPWRVEAREIFETLLKKGINVYFISNTGSTTVTKRLLELLEVEKLPPRLIVESGASKFRISELPLTPQGLSWKLPDDVIGKFENLPVVHKRTANGRPVHLRRAEYFRAICKVLNNDLERLKETVFCGDIWEMDLAMPDALGGNIHLIKRASPFDTYPYEMEAVTESKGKISEDLTGVLEWF